MQLKKNAPLIIAVAVPLLFIVFVALSIYLPQSLLDPQHDFVYTLPRDPHFTWNQAYDIRDGKIVKLPITSPVPRGEFEPALPTAYPDLYLYDVQTDESRQITFDEAQAFTMSDAVESPDGFTVKGGGYDGDIFSEMFGGNRNDYANVYIEKNSVSKRLNISLHTEYPYFNSQYNFVGWVLP